jgi:hypothetical protein
LIGPGRFSLHSRRNRKFFVLLAIIALIFFGSRTVLSYWVELLWFRSLGYGEVFLRQLALQWGIFAAFAVVTFFILYGTFLLLNRAHRDELPLDHTIVFGGREVNLSVRPFLRIFAIGASLLIALATGGTMASEWPTLALFWFAPNAAGTVADPIFGKPLNFFLFTLPAWNHGRWLASYYRSHRLPVGSFIHSHHQWIARLRRAQSQLYSLCPGAGSPLRWRSFCSFLPFARISVGSRNSMNITQSLMA